MTTRPVTVGDRYTVEEVASYYEQGFWERGSLYALVSEQAAVRPDKTFLFDSTVGYTYADLREQSARLALGLRRIGVHRGDRVVVQLPNWAEFGVIAVALSRIGAILVPVMPIYRADEVGYVLNHAEARVAISCVEFNNFRYLDMFAQLKGSVPSLETVVAVRADGYVGATSLGSLIVLDGTFAEIEAELGTDSDPDDPYIIVYTSGTTSRPKGCLHTVNTLRASAKAMAVGLEYCAQDVQFGPSPIAHSTGLITSFLLPLLKGASSHLLESWAPDEAMRRIALHRCTLSVTATAFLQMMMTAFDEDVHDLGSIRMWVCAGSPIPGAVVERARLLLSEGTVLSLYGRSENFMTTMCTSKDEAARAINSDGAALMGGSVKIVDHHGQEAPRGDEGDIAYKGPSHMLGYYRDPDATAAMFTADGYSRSGDLGRMDPDGYVRVTGRLKDIVIRGGLNISARELEDLLGAVPSIGSVAVVGMPDERLGERICVYVVPAVGDQPPTLEELLTYLREQRLAKPKMPERLEIVESLPMTATGKVQKHLLRADIADKLG